MGIDNHATKANQDPVVQQYKKQASIYDLRWAFYIESTVRETNARLAIAPESEVLDIGCGTGQLLEATSSGHPNATLLGVDPVAEMLKVARQRVPSSIPLLQGWAEALPLRSETFDWVVSCNVLHFIKRPKAALTEMWRVLRPGGQVVITDWCDDYLTCRLCDRYLRRVDPAHHKVYRSTECSQLLEAAGYNRIAVERYKISWLWGLMTATACKPLS